MLDTPEELRLQLLANGYSPLPNMDKRCFLKSWPDVAIDAETIHSWSRRHKRFAATGLRVENGLAVIDIDVNIDAETTDAIADAIVAAVPKLDRALVRWGKGVKEAWFVRTQESFSRIHTRRWTAPGGSPDAGTHVVEIFGGLVARQFGAFGAHTVDEDGNILVEYAWPGDSPANTRLDSLPELTKAEFFRVADTVESVLRARGCAPVERSTKGESDAVRVYDLTDDLFFDLADGRRVSLPDLRQLAKDEDGLRCSASWLEGPDPKRSPDRCIIGTTRHGALTVWDSASGSTHMEATQKPRDFSLDLDRVAEKLKELEAARRYRISSGDSAIVAAGKLLETYAFCPNQPLGVVPIWATALEDGMTMSSFRTLMLPNCDEEIGPRGGRIVINPVDIWAGSEKRKTVAGLRLRPDKPRPLYEDEGRQWVNIYAPPALPAEGGDAAVGVEFMEQLLPNDDERRWFLQWLAHKYRRPDIPGPAVVMVARSFGTGRGTLGVLIGKLFGQRYVQSLPFHLFAGRSYQSQYTEWGASSLVVLVSESSEANGGSMFSAKRDTYEHLKELVEPRPVEKTFVLKGKPSIKAMSFTSYIIATNNLDALPIPADDRRFGVLANGEPREPAYWERVNAWLDDDANIGAFGRWLMDVDLTGYSPFAAPLKTEAKADMSDAARTDLDRGLDEVLANLVSDVFVPEQIVAGLREAQRIYGYDYPDKWQPIAKRLVGARCWRVGVRDGTNWHPQIEGKRYSVFARSKEAAKNWTFADAARLRAEVLKNGSPAATGLPGNVLAGLFRQASTEKE